MKKNFPHWPQVRFLSLVILACAEFLGGCTLSVLAPFYSKVEPSLLRAWNLVHRNSRRMQLVQVTHFLGSWGPWSWCFSLWHRLCQHFRPASENIGLFSFQKIIFHQIVFVPVFGKLTAKVGSTRLFICGVLLAGKFGDPITKQSWQ